MLTAADHASGRRDARKGKAPEVTDGHSRRSPATLPPMLQPTEDNEYCDELDDESTPLLRQEQDEAPLPTTEISGSPYHLRKVRRTESRDKKQSTLQKFLLKFSAASATRVVRVQPSLYSLHLCTIHAMLVSTSAIPAKSMFDPYWISKPSLGMLNPTQNQTSHN